MNPGGTATDALSGRAGLPSWAIPPEGGFTAEARDRERKPALYAGAGIPHFWLVEREGGRPVVHVYELDAPTRAYVAAGIHRDRLKLPLPFAIDIDLTAVDGL